MRKVKTFTKTMKESRSGVKELLDYEKRKVALIFQALITLKESNF